LDNFELPVEVKEKRKEVLDDQSSQAIAFLVDPFHLSLEDLVISLENGIFVWKLLGDIWLTSED
jgi:hypothetical protein